MHSDIEQNFDSMLSTALLFAEAKSKTAGSNIEEILLKLNITGSFELADCLETAMINHNLYNN